MRWILALACREACIVKLERKETARSLIKNTAKGRGEKNHGNGKVQGVFGGSGDRKLFQGGGSAQLYTVRC